MTRRSGPTEAEIEREARDQLMQQQEEEAEPVDEKERLWDRYFGGRLPIVERLAVLGRLRQLMGV